jgi:hypothetical protein
MGIHGDDGVMDRLGHGQGFGLGKLGNSTIRPTATGKEGKKGEGEK